MASQIDADLPAQGSLVRSIELRTNFGHAKTELEALQGEMGTPAGSGHSHTLAGDVTGASSSTTVARIRGQTIATTTPAAGNVLTYSGGQWAPAALPANPPSGMTEMGAGVDMNTYLTEGEFVRSSLYSGVWPGGPENLRNPMSFFLTVRRSPTQANIISQTLIAQVSSRIRTFVRMRWSHGIWLPWQENNLDTLPSLRISLRRQAVGNGQGGGKLITVLHLVGGSIQSTDRIFLLRFSRSGPYSYTIQRESFQQVAEMLHVHPFITDHVRRTPGHRTGFRSPGSGGKRPDWGSFQTFNWPITDSFFSSFSGDNMSNMQGPVARLDIPYRTIMTTRTSVHRSRGIERLKFVIGRPTGDGDYYNNRQFAYGDCLNTVVCRLHGHGATPSAKIVSVSVRP